MELLGKIVRLQIQRSTLKPGERPYRWYDPAPLLDVPALAVEPSGVFGLTDSGERIVDVHNVEHPKSQNSGGMNASRSASAPTTTRCGPASGRTWSMGWPART
jgi:hypothetical protein